MLATAGALLLAGCAQQGRGAARLNGGGRQADAGSNSADAGGKAPDAAVEFVATEGAVRPLFGGRAAEFTLVVSHSYHETSKDSHSYGETLTVTGTSGAYRKTSGGAMWEPPVEKTFTLSAARLGELVDYLRQEKLLPPVEPLPPPPRSTRKPGKRGMSTQQSGALVVTYRGQRSELHGAQAREGGVETSSDVESERLGRVRSVFAFVKRLAGTL